MAKGTSFGTIHSDRILHLIQQKVEVQPAEPKTKYVDIPGGNGSKDLTEALGIGVKFKDRTISWTFALYPKDDWYSKQKEVSGLLNGLACRITLDGDPLYYYEGRLSVGSHKSNNQLRQITVKAVCRPYKLKKNATIVNYALNSEYKTILLLNSRMPVAPEITVNAATDIKFNGNVYRLSEGTNKILDIQLSEGANILEAKTGNGPGNISFLYREGAL